MHFFVKTNFFFVLNFVAKIIPYSQSHGADFKIQIGKLFASNEV